MIGLEKIKQKHARLLCRTKQKKTMTLMCTSTFASASELSPPTSSAAKRRMLTIWKAEIN